MFATGPGQETRDERRATGEEGHSSSPLTPLPAPLFWLIGIFGIGLGVLSARPFAGGWNDGSRLASVESLGDRGELAIDGSLFTNPLRAGANGQHLPYPPDRPDLRTSGTCDKLQIGGRFYSDKTPVISVGMAGLYRSARAVGLPAAAVRPDLFCRFLTTATSGVAYVVTLLCLLWLTQRLGGEKGVGNLMPERPGGCFAQKVPDPFFPAGIPSATAILLVASLGLSTFALAYTRHVNNHILLLAVAAGVVCLLESLARARLSGGAWLGKMLGLGTLAGIGYNLDFGAGPILFVCLGALVLWRWRRIGPVLAFLLAVLPWIAACHLLNYSIGGVFKPLNMVPEYLNWPGSPFGQENMTGLLRHRPLALVVYALALLFGKHGFFVHNLPMLLALPAAWSAMRQPSRSRPEVWCLLSWCGLTWLNYAAFSNNYGGSCCSVRWFVPFLAVGYYVLALHLRERPERWRDLALLSGWGAVLGVIMWVQGPWTQRMIFGLWPIVGAALLSWSVCRRRWNLSPSANSQHGELPLARAA